MKISMIAAMANNRVIGLDNKMPWHLPADLKFFRKMTTGKPVIMGRKTFESIGKPLPNRHNIVLTRAADFCYDGVTVVNNTDEALAAAGEVDEVVIIGGGNIYRQFLPLAEILYLTFIDLDTQGDTHFVEYQSAGCWQQVWQEAYRKEQGHPYNFQFVRLERTK